MNSSDKEDTWRKPKSNGNGMVRAESSVSTRTWLPWLIGAMPAVFVLIWSTGFIVARYGMPHAPPMKFLAIRYLLSAACLAVWIKVIKIEWPKDRKQWLHLSITGILIHAIYLGGVWGAVKEGMGAGLSSLLVSLQPVLTAIWLSGRGGQVSKTQWFGLTLGLIGLLFVVWAKLGVGEVSGVNLTLICFALLAITIGTLYQKSFVAPCDFRVAGQIQLISAFAVTLPVALCEQEGVRWLLDDGHWNSELIGAMGWSVLGLTLGASSLLYLLIQRGAATSVTSLFYLVPPTTAVLAWLLFKEPITVLTLSGTILTAFGVGIVIRKRS